MLKAIYYFFCVVFFVLLFFRGACVDQSSAVRAMNAAGHKDVRVGSHKWFMVGFRGCEATDAALFPVFSTNPAGDKVVQIVCVGWPFKAATIRTE